MKTVGNLLAILGIAVFIYAIVGRFVGAPTVFAFPNLPILAEIPIPELRNSLKIGFSADSMLMLSLGVMLTGVICLLNVKE